MKKTLLLFMLLSMAISIFAQDREIERPEFCANNTTSVEIQSVQLTAEATILKMKAYYHPKRQIIIASECYLEANDHKYRIKSTDEIKIDIPDAGTAEFTLTFEPLPMNTQRFNFIETESEDGFKIWGVEISGRALPELPLDPIFIDFWAAWCGPCIGAMKAAKTAKDQLKNKNVVYVYITNESSPLEKWKNMITDIPGIHIMLNKEQYKYMNTKEYQYNGIPSSAIIGKDGQKKFFGTGFQGAQWMQEAIEKEL